MSIHPIHGSLAILLIFAACGGQSYAGETFDRTAHVDVYYVEGSVERDFSVMGTIQSGSASTFAEWEADLASQAMGFGADAFLVEGLSSTEANSVGTNRADMNGRPRYTLNLNGGVSSVGGAEHHTRLAVPMTGHTIRLLKYGS